ncbi:ChaC-like protein [Dissoconium aciculare CBS 342.82]|uniref:glutathione-specific gamma-glutamylcyclotransferase n=1 Tax=Dissoconium aciculare CBS 342.82 TaxID=1314786 RepID=A0A6J3LPV3_9PEZI|nr:ChaC-like protein [Dissoconium aciculare CBS 342.82]KAF1817956.1 ChaC-like protein [Dissoconium aciculare CBS 342.82]
MSEIADQDLWLFGYGSLIWKPPPHYDLRLPGYIEGFVRRFWQVRSEDHRGTPEAPGRVVTLLERSFWESLTDQVSHASAPPKVWGAAYRIPAARVAEVTEYMNIREINGYTIQYTPFHSRADPAHTTTSQQTTDSTSIQSPIKCLVYIGLPTNPQFLGPQDPQALAEHIVASRGPSGENRDYLYELETALNELSPESGDEHVSDLARRCREVEMKAKGGEDEKK